MTSQPQPKYSFPLGGAVLFSLPNLLVGALALAMSVYLPRHYASHLGLSLATVGAAFGIVRMIDIVFDPFLGLVMDKTRTAFGRYRVWLIAGGPLFMIGIYMLFMAQEGVDQLYMIFWLLILYAGLSIIALSHSSWASVLAPKYNERSRLFGILQALGVVGATAVLLAPIFLANLNPGEGSTNHVPAMGWFMIRTGWATASDSNPRARPAPAGKTPRRARIRAGRHPVPAGPCRRRCIGLSRCSSRTSRACAWPRATRTM